jgi:hypothetical protein
MYWSVCLPKSLVTGRQLIKAWFGHRTEGALSLQGFTLWSRLWIVVENSVESSLSFSLFISLTLKGEINKVNVKQTISISLYHSVSVIHPNQFN